MSFTPYTTYRVHYPALKPGYIIKIGNQFYQVITARNNRPLIAISGVVTTTRTLDVGTSAEYEQLHGELKKGRIVQLQYVGITEAQAVNMYWGTEPLFSKDFDATILPARAGLSNPIGVDRWSYDVSMRLGIKQAGTQNYYFEIMEYEVIPYTGTPPRPYLQILPNGQAILVESAESERTLSMLAANRRQRGESGGAD